MPDGYFVGGQVLFADNSLDVIIVVCVTSQSVLQLNECCLQDQTANTLPSVLGINSISHMETWNGLN